MENHYREKTTDTQNYHCFEDVYIGTLLPPLFCVSCPRPAGPYLYGLHVEIDYEYDPHKNRN